MAHLASSQLYSIKGWVAVVTGGGTGIGLMIAKTLAASGAKVYITGRREHVLEQTAKTHGSPEALGGGRDVGSIVPLPCDVTDKENLIAVAKTVASKESGLKLLVNNAGINPPRVDVSTIDNVDVFAKAMLDQDPSDWASTYVTNVTSVFYATAAFLPLLKKGGGSIVNISSVSGITKYSQAGQYAYNSSKAATIQLTNLMATDFAHPSIGVRINSIAPGYFPSQMTAGSADAQNESTLDQSYLEGKRVPAGRVGNEKDIGQACLAFAVNDYINGQTIAVDGGYLLEHP